MHTTPTCCRGLRTGSRHLLGMLVSPCRQCRPPVCSRGHGALSSWTTHGLMTGAALRSPFLLLNQETPHQRLIIWKVILLESTGHHTQGHIPSAHGQDRWCRPPISWCVGASISWWCKHRSELWWPWDPSSGLPEAPSRTSGVAVEGHHAVPVDHQQVVLLRIGYQHGCGRHQPGESLAGHAGC